MKQAETESRLLMMMMMIHFFLSAYQDAQMHPEMQQTESVWSELNEDDNFI